MSEPKSYWNYRFCVQAYPDGLGGEEDVWTVREVYWTDGRASAWSADPMHAQGSSFTECLDDLERMTGAAGQSCFRIVGDHLEELVPQEKFPAGPVS